MVKIGLYSFLMLTSFIAPCQDETCRISVEVRGSYANQKQAALVLRRTWASKYKKAKEEERSHVLDSAGLVFKDFLVDNILPHWHGTTWAFSGFTAIPNQGEVACGYLVSTSLLHMGLNINRYKLAQQAPAGEAKTVYCGKPPIIIDKDTCWKYFNHLDEGLYFVGLDNHVGFLNVKEDDLEFIHSNYSGETCVMAEYALCSGPFNWSQKFYLAPISSNREFIKKWLFREPYEIYK
jgi:hypothetical protein